MTKDKQTILITGKQHFTHISIKQMTEIQEIYSRALIMKQLINTTSYSIAVISSITHLLALRYFERFAGSMILLLMYTFQSFIQVHPPPPTNVAMKKVHQRSIEKYKTEKSMNIAQKTVKNLRLVSSGFKLRNRKSLGRDRKSVLLRNSSKFLTDNKCLTKACAYEIQSSRFIQRQPSSKHQSSSNNCKQPSYLGFQNLQAGKNHPKELRFP